MFIVDAREADGGIEGHTVPLRFGGREHATPTKTRCFCGWWENLRKKALTNSVVMWLYQLKVMLKPKASARSLVPPDW